MLLPVILAALLSVDQPIAPVPAGSASGAFSGPFLAVETASRRFVIIGEHIREVTEDGVRPFATLPGPADSVTAVGEDLLVVVEEYVRRSIVRVHADGTVGSPRPPLDLVFTRAPMAASGNRVLMFAEHEAEVLLFDDDGFLVRRFLAASDFPAISFPAVAAGEDSFLLAWLEDRRLFARAVARDGNFLSDAILISKDGSWPAIASDGRRFLLTWTSFSEIKGQRLTFDGQLLGEPLTIDPTGAGNFGHAAGWDGLHYAVAFEKNGNLQRVDISRGGEITDRRVLASGPEHHVDPEISGSLIAWRVRTPCYTAEKLVAMLPGREPVLASIGNPVRFGAQTVAVGDTFATVWLDRTDILRARARAGEKVTELSDRVVRAAPAIATAGDRALIVFAESDESMFCGSYLVAAVIDADGTVLARTKIEARVYSFAAASDGTDFVLVWTSSDSGKTALHAMRLDATGKVVDRPREVTSEAVPGPWLTFWMAPSIAWDGSEYLVIWQRLQRNVGVRLQRLSRTLAPIESVRTLSDAVNPAAISPWARRRRSSSSETVPDSAESCSIAAVRSSPSLCCARSCRSSVSPRLPRAGPSFSSSAATTSCVWMEPDRRRRSRRYRGTAAPWN